MNPLRKALIPAILGVALVGVVKTAVADEMPFYFKNAAWLCTEAQFYDQAVQAVINLDGKSFEQLREEQLAQRKCYYLEEDQIGDVNAPYISVLETEGDIWKITFVLQFEKRHAFLHRDLSWYTFTGWTHSSNLKRLWSADLELPKEG